MKEQFEKRALTGFINVACKFDDGTVRYWNTSKEEVIEHVIEIVEDYEQQGYVLTLRQLHYQLVTRNWTINHDSAYKKLGKILDDLKYSGIIDWDSIEDRGRKPYIPYSVNNIGQALSEAADYYRLNRQEGQKVYIELWTEKDALAGILKRTTEKYHIQLVVNKGYTSSSAIYAAYDRYLDKIKNSQRIKILYFGDHDPSGLDMIRDIRERLETMFLKGRFSDVFEKEKAIYDKIVEVIPIGLSMQQIKYYHLPENPTKLTDSRARGYIKKFGKSCWEVDALKPDVLTSIVDQNIENLIDMDLYGEMLEKEQRDTDELRSFIDTRNN